MIKSCDGESSAISDLTEKQDERVRSLQVRMS